MIVSGRAGFEAARAHSVSWWLAQAALTAAGAVLLPDVDAVPVGRSHRRGHCAVVRRRDHHRVRGRLLLIQLGIVSTKPVLARVLGAPTRGG